MKKTKYIFITGGVCSSLGKGIAASSIGAILKYSGFKVFSLKLDPYLNVDPGTMNPFQHGEVYVLEDGAETDLDLGHYERFINEDLSELSSVTTGKVYSEVIANERKGAYLGGTIQIIPHITNAIKKRIVDAGKKSKADIVLVEIGGTTGDIEGLPYLEAIRQMRTDFGSGNTFFCHVTLLPFLAGAKELKTKPTQASVRELRSIGLQPDMILARADHSIKKDLIKKIALFCNVAEEAVIPAPTVDSIYQIPLDYSKNNVHGIIANQLKLGKVTPKLNDWKKLVDKIKAKNEPLKIALVGKYTGLDDAYLSVIEALKASCYHQKHVLDLIWIDSGKLEENDQKTWDELRSAHGVIVPGGFGIRGTEGKIETAKYCRENNVPYLGICLGMQIMTIDYARTALKNKDLTSEEFDEGNKKGVKNHVINFLPGQNAAKDKGGTLRLGSYPCRIKKDTITYKYYKTDRIDERHRHRYEFNNKFKKQLEKAGLVISGINPREDLVEIVENPNHPYMVGCQFHPEFKSRPHKPHPLFYGLISASIKQKKANA